MATFPEFRLTGPTIPLEEKPMEFKPLNLLPLIELLRESKQPIGKQASDKGKTPKDDKIEGRIGAVDQYESAIRKQMNIINKGFDLYGTSFSDMPEYKMAMTKYENLTSDDRKNVIARQTKDVDSFKEQTKGKGSYFHIGQWISTGLTKDGLKRNKEWANIQERGYTGELGNQQSDYSFIEDFDFNPTLYSVEDAREAADALYNPAAAGSNNIRSHTKDFVNDWKDNLLGTYENEVQIQNDKNFGVRDGVIVGYDENKNPIYEKVGLDSGHQQAVQRVFKQMFDPSDKLTAGYLQGFLQRGSFNPDDYYDKKGNIKIEKFVNDFGDYMEKDLEEHYTKRKTHVYDYKNFTTFEEASESGYKRAIEKEEADIMSAATIQNEMSISNPYGLGIDFGDLFSTDFELGYSYISDGFIDKKNASFYDQYGQAIGNILLYDFDNSPFVINAVEGKKTINLNPDFSYPAFTKSNDNPMWKKAYDYAKNMGTKYIPNPENFANKVIDDALSKRALIQNKLDAGKGLIGTTRNTVTLSEIPASGIKPFWYDAVNHSSLKGQSAENFGVGMFGQLGEGYFNLSSLGKDLVYDGVEGPINFQPNRMPTNLYTVVIENGKPKAYNWNHQEWLTLSNEKKEQLMKKALEDSKTNPICGTDFRKGNLQKSNEVEFKSNERVRVMDEFTSNMMAKYVSDPNNTNNAIYAAPGAAVQPMRFKAKDKSTIIKNLEKIDIDVELPSNYHSDEQYKKLYNKTFYYGIFRTQAHDFATMLAINGGIVRKNFTIGGEYSKSELAQIFNIPKDKEDYFYNKVKSIPKGTKPYVVQDLVIRCQTGEVQNWNWNTTVPILVTQKAATNGQINPNIAEKIHITERTATAENPYGASVTIPGNVTPVVAKQGNSSAKSVLSTGINSYSRKLVDPNVAKTKDGSVLNSFNARK